MRLTLYAVHSLRLLIYGALGGPVTIQEVAEAYGNSENQPTRVTFDLARAGFVETMRGGGLRLAKAPEEIGLGDVLGVTEGSSVPVECFHPRTNSCMIAAPCRLRNRVLKAWFAVLDEYTQADLTAGDSVLSRILVPA
jgi:Rrf2 family transcriptional regulator, nitric oxide-sensitive transcriptional repressor